MKIAIIGGGFTGLTAAYRLSQQGHDVTIFEKNRFLGGLAIGWKEPHWQWSLEAAYHHLFTNDHAILSLIEELGMKNNIIIKRPTTSTLYQNKMFQLDSPLSLLTFPGLPFIDRFRTGLFVAVMKLNPFWQPLEKLTSATLAKNVGGQNGWATIWEPLLTGKFGQYADSVAASWLWARIKKRTASLAYIEGGFQTLIDQLVTTIRNLGTNIVTECEIQTITKNKKGQFIVQFQTVKTKKTPTDNTDTYDQLILTIPTPLIQKICSFIPASYFTLPNQIPHLHAQVLVIESHKPLLKDVYWLNITDRTYPFLAVVQHTNYMDVSHYGGNQITYIGNYLPPNHPYLQLDKKALLKEFTPFLTKLNPQFKTIGTMNSFLFTAPYAQPVHQLNYSKKAPPLTTPIPNLFIANMDSIFPWDRGTNYAVELGEKVASLIQKNRPQ